MKFYPLHLTLYDDTMMMTEKWRRTVALGFGVCWLLLNLTEAFDNSTNEYGSCALAVRRCEFWEFQCDNMRCINMRKFCDGFPDCPGGEDEIQVNYTVPGTVACNNVRNDDVTRFCLLPRRHICDGTTDCADFADESPAQCGYKSPYKKQPSRYLPLNNLVIDCPECSTLIGCEGGKCIYKGTNQDHQCASYIFRCLSDGKCLRAEQFCDGITDCADGSDESPTPLSTEGIMCSSKWNNETKQCYLPPIYICDGIDHCSERADECVANCSRSQICLNGNCIAGHYFGDGRDDCGDSSDECPSSFGLKTRVFTCLDGTCLAYEKFCDGRTDCPDGSDEIHPRNGSLWNVSDKALPCSNIINALNLTCLLPGHHVCDDFEHCSDHSDEWQCDNSQNIKCHNKRVVLSLKKCNFVDDCHDSSDECMYPDCNRTFTCLRTRKCIAFSRFCDGVDDCGDGSDEMTEEELSQHGGVMCNNSHNECRGRCVLPQRYVCDGLDHCENRADECHAGCTHSFTCDDGQCIERHRFCDGKLDCKDKSDEQVIGPGFKCPVSDEVGEARVCVLPQYMVNDSRVDCVSNADSCRDNPLGCFRCLDRRLMISDTQVCDGVFDCLDLSDECACERNSSLLVPKLCQCMHSDAHCSLCLHDQLSCGGDQCIGQSQVCDGRRNCGNNADEENCYKKSSSKETQEKQFPCPLEGDLKAVECDGIPECSLHFADECSFVQVESSGSDGVPERRCGNATSPICTALDVFYHEENLGFYHCPSDTSKFLRTAMICDGVEDCSVGTTSRMTSREVRTWSDLSADERHCPQRHLCQLSRPINGKVSIHETRVCDGQIDCLLEEDEAEELCKNRDPTRFYCESRARDFISALGLDATSSRDPLFVSQSVVFDGKFDCWDGSDECPSASFEENGFSSKYDMIKNELLRVLVWMMAIVALLGNLVVAWHTSTRLYRMRRLSPMMRTNLILVLNLAFADFLMGIYLLALAIQNTRLTGRYCKADSGWRTSSSCAALGTLAMISIQSSVMFLVILTSYRVVAVLRPFRANTMNARYTVLMVAMSWCMSIAIAVLPRNHAFEDYFTENAWIMPSVEFFPTNQPDKAMLHRFAERLRALFREGKQWEGFVMSQASGVPETWVGIRDAITKHYPSFWPQLNIRGYFGYYSTNSVCLPNIFVTVEDSAWAYSVGVMTFDLLAFLYVLIAYLVIYHDAAQSVTASRNDEENRTMQARITRLVLTDFACWGPLCIIAFVSLAGVTIQPEAYAFAAIVMLPINSALNPIIYSNVLHVVYSSCIGPLVSTIHERARRSRDNISRIRRRTTSMSRTSLAGTISTNDCAPPMEGAMLLSRLEQKAGAETP